MPKIGVSQLTWLSKHELNVFHSRTGALSLTRLLWNFCTTGFSKAREWRNTHLHAMPFLKLNAGTSDVILFFPRETNRQIKIWYSIVYNFYKNVKPTNHWLGLLPVHPPNGLNKLKCNLASELNGATFMEETPEFWFEIIFSKFCPMGEL